jgi:hypothetical protein
MLAFLRARALNRGLLGGSTAWILIGGAVWTIRLFQILSRSEVVYRDVLQPGESIVISHAPGRPKGRRARRRARRSA